MFVSAPELTGVPRVGESMSLYAGELDRAITTYFYDFTIDAASMTGFPTTTAEDAISFSLVGAAEDKTYAGSVKASEDGGATWSALTPAEVGGIANISTVVTASTRSITGVRTSASGTVPMIFTITGKRYSSDQWEYVLYDTDNTTVLFQSMIPITETNLGAPTTPDFSEAVPPIPDWATLSATPALLFLHIRLVSADYMPGADRVPIQGIASNWVTLTPTTSTVSTYDPLNKGPGMTLSSGNLTATRSSSFEQGVRTTRSHTGAKVYAEFTVNDIGGATLIGIVDQNAVMDNVDWKQGMVDKAANASVCALWVQYGHGVYNTGGSGNYQADIVADGANGNRYAIAHDEPGDRVWFKRLTGGGAWGPGSGADPATGVGGFNVSAMNGNTFFGAQVDFGSGSVTAHLSSGSWTGSAPSGFGAA